MKRILYLASALAIFGACTNEIDKVSEISTDRHPIEFDTYVAGQTRAFAYEATADTLATKGFQVYAWNNETAIGDSLGLYFSDMYHQEAEGSSIVANSKHEWPGATSLSFLAVYPAVQEIISMETPKAEGTDANLYKGEVVPSATVSVSTNKGDAPGTSDVMCAYAEDKTAAGGVVNLAFSHILVKVQANLLFDASLKDGSGNGPCINTVKLKGISSGKYDASESKWSTSADAITAENGTEYLLFSTDESQYLGSITDYEPLYDYDHRTEGNQMRVSLMLIPAQYELSVTYGYSNTMTATINLADTQIEGGEKISLSGKVVILNIHIKDNHISFATPTVESWETGDAIPVD